MRAITPTPPIRIRAIEPGDRAALVCFYQGLSPASLILRFHGACRGIGECAAGVFCGPDHEHREGLVATIGGSDGAEPVVVGHVCLEPSGDRELEVAVAVADAWQRHGIGRRLLVASVDWAALHGIDHLWASMLMSNAGMLAVVRSLGRPFALTMSGAGVLDVSIDVSPAVRSAA